MKAHWKSKCWISACHITIIFEIIHLGIKIMSNSFAKHVSAYYTRFGCVCTVDWRRDNASLKISTDHTKIECIQSAHVHMSGDEKTKEKKKITKKMKTVEFCYRTDRLYWEYRRMAIYQNYRIRLKCVKYNSGPVLSQ